MAMRGRHTKGARSGGGPAGIPVQANSLLGYKRAVEQPPEAAGKLADLVGALARHGRDDHVVGGAVTDNLFEAEKLLRQAAALLEEVPGAIAKHHEDDFRPVFQPRTSAAAEARADSTANRREL